MGETWGGGPRGIRRLRRACFQFRITKWTLETSSKLARGDIGAVARLGPSSLFFLLLRGGRSRTLRARARFVPPLVLREVTHSLKLESHRLSSSKVFEVAKNRHQRREHSQTDNGFPQTPYGPSKLARVDFFSPSCLLRFWIKRVPKSHKKSLESTKSPSRRQPTPGKTCYAFLYALVPVSLKRGHLSTTKGLQLLRYARLSEASKCM